MRASRQRGFTLMELLVVVTMIAALSAVSALAYREGKRQANRTVSATNLRNLAAANLMYAAEHQTYCPMGEMNRRWHGGRSTPNEPFDPRRGYLSEYLGESQSVGICPELQGMLDSKSSWELGTGGYGYNSTYIGGMPGFTFVPNRPANVPSPERTLMFASTAFAKADGLQEYGSAAPPYSVSPNWKTAGPLQPSVHFRFGGKALVAWCDGHVSSERMSHSNETNFYGGENKTANFGIVGPKENNGWWNPRH